MIFKILTILSFVWVALGLESSLIIYDSESIDLNKPTQELKLVVNYLNEANHTTILRGYTEEDLVLYLGQESVFSNIILFPTESKKITNKEQLNKHNLMNFINNSGNLVFVGDSAKNYPDDIREFLNEVGIYPSPKGYSLLDHFNNDDKVHLTNDNIGCSRILSEIKTEYSGQSAIISNNENLISVLRSSKTSVSTNDIVNSMNEENTWSIGQQNHVIVGLQSLNNNRLLWLGDVSLLSDELLSWAFQMKNKIKLQFVQHYKNDEPEKINDTLYRIKDQVIYTIGVSELINNEWKPYVVQDDDAKIQLAFKMLDPYYRINLEPLGPTSSTEDGEEDTFIYFTNFTIPDQHGMFTFDLDYKRSGLNYLNDKRVVAVRHLANDEYKRSWNITNSWFYVASATLVVIGWLLFVVQFVYIGKTDKGKKDI